ncbi:MAG: hypothetical protein H0U55_14050 [Rubrobacteraceae bacterium]|nr:hypothetical protein [Rubrobacteraceae bacterium]
MSRLRRVRITRTPPARAAATSLGRSTFGTFSDAMRKLVVDDLRPGVVHVGDLSRLTQMLAWLGFILVFAGVGMLFFNEPLREAFPLLPMLGGTTGRGELVPFILIPVTIFILSVAWGFMLAGALHARLIVRLAVLLLYLVVAGVWTAGTATSIPAALVSWSALLLVPAFFFLRRKAKAAPAPEFGVLLILVSLTFGVSQIYAIQAWRASGVPGVLANVPTLLYTFDMLVIPLMLFIGVDIAEFVHKTASWTSGLTDAWAGRRVLYAVLFLLLGWRLVSVVLETVERVGKSSPADQAAAYAGALVIPLSAGAVWWLLRRHGGDLVTVETLLDVAKRVAMPLIAIYLGLQGVEIAVILIGGLIGLLFVGLGLGGPGDPGGALEIVGQLIAQDANWQTLLAAVAIVAALLLARRGRTTLALYLGILGANALWIGLTNPGRPLDYFGWSGLEPVDFWWVVIFAAVAVYWLARARLTEDRARRLLLLVVITLLMRQTGFIEDPFSPVLGFTGVGMIALGLIWDALTIGFWANEDSPGLPRVSRIWLYLGYILFSIAVLNWSVASHDILQVDFFTGQAALGGFGIFGKPLIYAIFAVTLAGVATGAEEADLDTPHTKT